MKIKYILPIVGVLAIYCGLTYYVGTHIFALGSNLFGHINPVLFYIVLYMISFSFFLTRFSSDRFPKFIQVITHYISGYWMGLLPYLLFFCLIFDCFRFIAIKTTYLSHVQMNRLGVMLGLGIIILLTFKLIYGTLNRHSIHVEKYKFKLNKPLIDRDQLKIVMISDLHLGTINNKSFLEKIVSQINDLRPDMVAIVGDIIDDKIEEFLKNNMQNTIKDINAPLGIYAVSGNHDIFGGDLDKLKDSLSSVGIHFLSDASILTSSNVRVIGREDVALERFSGKSRKSLQEIIPNDIGSEILILLDHQPNKLNDAVEARVDLQLSGHTHRGQMYPFHLITKKIFELDWGYLKKDESHFIVSSGVGTWGPPIRTGSKSEIVEVIISN